MNIDAGVNNTTIYLTRTELLLCILISPCLWHMWVTCIQFNHVTTWFFLPLLGTRPCACAGLWNLPNVRPSPNWCPSCATSWQTVRRRWGRVPAQSSSPSPFSMRRGSKCCWPYGEMTPLLLLLLPSSWQTFFLFQLYHNMMDQTSSEYQNAPATLEILAKEKTAQSLNDYCSTHETKENKAEVFDTAEEKLLKKCDVE